MNTLIPRVASLLLALATLVLAENPAETAEPSGSPAPNTARLTARVSVLSVTIGSRPTTSPSEAEAISYLAAELIAIGYFVEQQPVTTSVGT